MNLFYNIFICPIVIILEISFELFNKIFKNTPISILGVSTAVSLFCLPLYIIAEKWQSKEREIQKKMAPKINKIKSVFKGDERFMILNTYYKQNNYHPLYALRSSFGILIQIPFFIAAYSYLSHLEALKDVSFLFINNLSKPDSLFSIGNFTINILPLLMTALNITSAIIYTKGFPLKDKIQVYGISIIFLLLLYNSPAALVIYWTMNNIFSLIKNIFYKIKNPVKIIYILFYIIISFFILYVIFFNTGALKMRLFFIIFASFFLFIPLYIKFFIFFQKIFLSSLCENTKQLSAILFIYALSMVLLTGFCIPSAVISSSPQEFIFSYNVQNPLIFIFNTFTVSFGCFIFWPACIYFLYGKKIKSFITVLFVFLTLISLINSFLFQGNYGMISGFLQFETSGVFNHSLRYVLLNIFSILLGAFLVFFVIKQRWLSQLFIGGLIIILALGLFTVYNSINIQKGYNRYKTIIEKEGEFHKPQKIFNLSKDKPNVIVFMIDRAINGYLKPIFDAKPELYDIYEGFVFYPNTVSYSVHTIKAVPPLWGGFDYTPMEMNKRSSVSLREKHNQALFILPSILADNGFIVTVTDPSFANYEWIPDTTIYKDMDNITAINTIGRYTSYWFQENDIGNRDYLLNTIKRNFIFFSFLKITPPPLRFIAYDNGLYWGDREVTSFNMNFFDSYAVLDYLGELTSFDAEQSRGLLITNDTTHTSTFLQYPDYIPVKEITDIGPGKFNEDKIYHTNAAFFIRMAEWLVTLKENNVYDNTRIIIVSDHGTSVDSIISDIPIPGERREKYHPLLLVKDFNKQGRLTEDHTFMTNADVPLLTLNGIVENPVNPFTGNTFSFDYKTDGAIISIDKYSMPGHHGIYQFNIKDDQWVHVKDDIFNNENWKFLYGEN